MSKILITMEGGLITSICSTDNVEVAVIDYDLPDNGDDEFVYSYLIDKKFKAGEAYKLIEKPLSSSELEARATLKEMNF